MLPKHASAVESAKDAILPLCHGHARCQVRTLSLVPFDHFENYSSCEVWPWKGKSKPSLMVAGCSTGSPLIHPRIESVGFFASGGGAGPERHAETGGCRQLAQQPQSGHPHCNGATLTPRETHCCTRTQRKQDQTWYRRGCGALPISPCLTASLQCAHGHVCRVALTCRTIADIQLVFVILAGSDQDADYTWRRGRRPTGGAGTAAAVTETLACSAARRPQLTDNATA